MSRDPRIDTYIERQAEFAQPILERLRAMVHSACPSAQESIKWGAPAFMYKGEILGMMAGFKAHAAFNLWRGKQVTGDTGRDDKAMGQFGRIASLDDLPDEAHFTELVQKAMALVDTGVKAPRTKKAEAKPPAETPEDLKAALDGNPAASATFDGFSPSAKRDYVEWVTGAKQAATREKRVAQAVEWMAEGKKRNWKYERC